MFVNLKATRDAINRFMTENFNHVLRLEERSLADFQDGTLSLKEFHIIEAVCREEALGGNTMGEVSRRLGVTMGTLTTSAKTLEKKGYLMRQKGSDDRRQVWLIPTALSREANEYHKKFHDGLVNAVMGCLDEKQLCALVGALRVLGKYFSRKQQEAALEWLKDAEPDDGPF